MIIQSIRLNQFDPNSIGIVWDVVGPSGAYAFFVERSESPEGPWTTLNPIGLVNVYGYVDRTVNREAFDRHLYYRIHCIHKQTGEEIISKHASTLEETGTWVGKYIAKQERLLLRRWNGVKCAVYIRRTFGERCSHCYDAVRGKSISDSCTECFGTTFKGGYFAPILMDINFNPRQKTQDRNVLQRTENDQVSAWCSNYPVLSYDDLIVEIERNNERYLVKTIQQTEHGNATVHQNLSLMKLHLSTPQFLVPQAHDIRSIDDVNVFRVEWV